MFVYMFMFQSYYYNHENLSAKVVIVKIAHSKPFTGTKVRFTNLPNPGYCH